MVQWSPFADSFVQNTPNDDSLMTRYITSNIREGLNGKKKRFLSGIARIRVGGGLPMPEFFGPLFRSLFLQKCQCIELLTVF